MIKVTEVHPIVDVADLRLIAPRERMPVDEVRLEDPVYMHRPFLDDVENSAQRNSGERQRGTRSA